MQCILCACLTSCAIVYSRLTKDFAGQVSEADVSVPLVVVQATQAAVAVKGQNAETNKESGASAPTKEGHDQEWVPKNEGIVQCCNHVESHFPG